MAKAKTKTRKDLLYPAIEPYRVGRLQVSPLHRLYFEESGNPGGKPVVFLHGGPGGGTDPRMRCFFNPRHYRIVLFDQRGCGRSTPHASLEENTTWDLVGDIENLRVHLGIEKWQVFGGSWGATLALAYAQTHPQQVSELVLRGIFLLRRSELEWFYQNSEGAASLYPDLWEQFVAPIPEEERHDMMRAYYRRRTSADTRERNVAARAWSIWEGGLSFLRSQSRLYRDVQAVEICGGIRRIECHYFINGGFLDADDQPLRDCRRYGKSPRDRAGSHDLVCPMRSAWHLHRAWPKQNSGGADAGHSAFEPGMRRHCARPRWLRQEATLASVDATRSPLQWPAAPQARCGGLRPRRSSSGRTVLHRDQLRAADSAPPPRAGHCTPFTSMPCISSKCRTARTVPANARCRFSGCAAAAHAQADFVGFFTHLPPATAQIGCEFIYAAIPPV